MMNGSKSCSASGGPQAPAPNPKRRRPGLRLPCSPSPRPSPRGEGETFARALVIRPSSVVVCVRDEGQRSGNCNSNVQIFKGRASALPLLGERVGVRGNEANSSLRRTTILGTVKLRGARGRYVFSLPPASCRRKGRPSHKNAANARRSASRPCPCQRDAGSTLNTFPGRARGFPTCP
jgi:hypothetical protein